MYKFFFYKKAHIFVAFHHFSGGGEDDRGWVKVADVPAMGPHLDEDNNSWEDFQVKYNLVHPSISMDVLG